MKLNCSDRLHIQAARGWLLLGQPDEAQTELECIDRRKFREYWSLLLLWDVHKAQHHWPECLEVATDMARYAPDMFEGPLYQSHALHELGRTLEAWKVLRPVARNRRSWWLIQLVLARYGCRLGKIKESRRLLMLALERGGDQARAWVLKDPELELLRPMLPDLQA